MIRNNKKMVAPIIATLVLGLLLFSGLEFISAGGQPSPAGSQAKFNISDGRWSDASIWNDGKLPGTGDAVKIAKNSQVVYDVFSEVEIAELTIEGSLIFSRSVSTNLDVGDVLVEPMGYLEIGTDLEPIPSDLSASVRIVNSTEGEHSLDVLGEAQIHGQPLTYVYTTLAEDAIKGSVTLRLRDSVDWKPGDHIVITSTTQDPLQSEENYITEINGRTIGLSNPLKYRHDGRDPASAQVALLTRNVVITSKNPERRGHTRYLAGAKGSISYAEFSHLGAKGKVGKYPIHFHMAGETMRGSYVKGASIWDSGNRFITVHSTQYITLSYNVGYNAVGHGFFLEIGDEVFVTMDHNLGILVTRGDILPTDSRAAVFWIQNPLNSLTNNIAVSSRDGSGFEFAIPGGQMDIAVLGGNVIPRNLPLLKFEGNEAHSNRKFGVRAYHFSTQLFDVSELTGLNVWRNRQRGLWLEGHRMKISRSVIFGNGEINVSLAGDSNVLEEVTIMGELPLVRSQGLMSYPTTPRGIVLVRPKNDTISKVTLEGHESNGGVVGSDISLGQEHVNQMTALIVDTVMTSSRPIIFGNPVNEGSKLEVRNFEGVPGDDFVLVRMDVTPPIDCAGGVVDLSFVARKCPLSSNISSYPSPN